MITIALRFLSSTTRWSVGLPRVMRAVALLVGLSLLGAACASQPRAGTDGAGAQESAGKRTGSKPVVKDLLAPGGGKIVLSPEGDWFVDEKGEYYLVEVERKPTYTILPTKTVTMVMLPPGAAFELVEERGNILVVKLYNPASLAQKPVARAAEPARFSDLEQFEISTADRLRFVPSNHGLPGRGQWRQGFELVDLNGDGNLDIVYGAPRKGDGKPKIFLGDGQGGWRVWREATFAGQPLDYGDVAVADFDGDGELDLALAVHLRGLMIMRGDGHGHFREWGEGLPYWVPGSDTELPPFSTRTVAAIDWNRDGRMDLLTLGEGPRIIQQRGVKTPGFGQGERGAVLFLNRGDGKFERYDQGIGREVVFGDGLAVGDFNGDGISDFAVASRVKGSSKIVNLGKADGGWEEGTLGALARAGGIYGSVHAVDLDADGRDELLLGYAASAGGDEWTGIDLVEYEAGAWARKPLVAEKARLGAVTAITTGDVDGDGRLDVVALTGAGDRWILLGTGNGTFVREKSTELAAAEPECQGYGAGVLKLADNRSIVIMGFAGEPGSEQIFDQNVIKNCPSGGSLEAWTPAP
jgi:hypothetical protein